MENETIRQALAKLNHISPALSGDDVAVALGCALSKIDGDLYRDTTFGYSERGNTWLVRVMPVTSDVGDASRVHYMATLLSASGEKETRPFRASRRFCRELVRNIRGEIEARQLNRERAAARDGKVEAVRRVLAEAEDRKTDASL